MQAQTESFSPHPQGEPIYTPSEPPPSWPPPPQRQRRPSQQPGPTAQVCPPPFPKPCRGVTTYLAPAGLRWLLLSTGALLQSGIRCPVGAPPPPSRSKTSQNVAEKNGYFFHKPLQISEAVFPTTQRSLNESLTEQLSCKIHPSEHGSLNPVPLLG